MMRAITIPRPGPPEVLTLSEVDTPRPGRHDVLIRVSHSGVNRADIGLRVGRSPDPGQRAVPIPGLEYSGVITEIGSDVTGFSVGDEVMGIEAGGCYAEFVISNFRQVMPIPTGISLPEAAAIPEVFLTAWDALFVQGGMRSGGWALVHAGASGVGTAAIQLVKALGGHVAVTCSAMKVDACLNLGADIALQRSPHDWLGDFSRDIPQGADVVLDVVGGDEIARNFAAVAEEGTIIQVGLLAGRGPITFNPGTLVSKRASWIGTTLKNRPLEQKTSLTQRFVREITPLFASGALKPVIDSYFPLEQAKDAHHHMEANANIGKILLAVAPEF